MCSYLAALGSGLTLILRDGVDAVEGEELLVEADIAFPLGRAGFGRGDELDELFPLLHGKVDLEGRDRLGGVEEAQLDALPRDAHVHGPLFGREHDP